MKLAFEKMVSFGADEEIGLEEKKQQSLAVEQTQYSKSPTLDNKTPTLLGTVSNSPTDVKDSLNLPLD